MRFLLIGLLLLAACNPTQENCGNDNGGFSYPDTPVIPESPPQIQKQVRFYNSCAEIIDDALKASSLSQSYQYYGSYNDQCLTSLDHTGSDGQIQADESNNLNQPTNTQEDNVDEADRVKISQRYIFYARENSIAVLSRDSKEFVQSIPVSGHWRPHIYVYNETLVVIRSHEKPFIDDQEKNAEALVSISPVYVQRPERFDVVFYDVRNEIREIRRRTVAGYYKSSRLAQNGLLTIVTGINLVRGVNPKQKKDYIQSLLSHVDCTQVARPGVSDLDHAITSVNSFKIPNIESPNYHKQTHLVGEYGSIYQNKDLILTKNHVQWFWWDQRNSLDRYTNIAVRLEENNDKWKIHSRFEFQGDVLGPWSFSEQGDYLFVATTRNPEPSGLSATHLEVFKKTKTDTLRITGVTGIAPGETLRSARFTKDYAYLVTFLTTDPLFIIDIKNPEAPRLISELKIPGFSSYLHDTNDGRLIGVGYQNWNLQLSLFDVDNPIVPKTLDQFVVEGGSSSNAQTEHHAFFYSDEWQLMGLPVRTRTYNRDWSKSLRHTGAFFYDLSKNQIDSIGRVSHSDWVQSICKRYGEWDGSHYWVYTPGQKDVSRVHKIDNALMTFSDFGARVHNSADPNIELQSTLFDQPEDSCPKPYAVCNLLITE